MKIERSKRRDERQRMAMQWVEATFGEKPAHDVRERVLRLVEEVLELAQAENLSEVDIIHLASRVFVKPRGLAVQEVGGVGLTLLAYCAATGISADEREAAELARVSGIDRETFRARQAAKAAAEIGMPPEGWKRSRLVVSGALCSCTHPVEWHSDGGCTAEGTEVDPGEPGSVRPWRCICRKNATEAQAAAAEAPAELKEDQDFGMVFE